MADEWNAESVAPSQTGHPVGEIAPSVKAQSQAPSQASKGSFASRVKEQKQKEIESRPEWNASTTSETRNMATDDRIASQIANEVLKDNSKLKGVHSKQSVKKILEMEAKKQMNLNNE